MNAGSGEAHDRHEVNVERPAIVHVVGGATSVAMIASVVRSLKRSDVFEQVVVQIGQRTGPDADWTTELGVPTPGRFIGHITELDGERTAHVITEFERVLIEFRPALVLVSDDVDSTLACALAAAKCGVPVAHIPAGLRSGDWTASDEINRVLTDHVADTLFTGDPEASANLLGEGIVDGRIHYVGNPIVDSLRRLEHRARRLGAWRKLGLVERQYVLVDVQRFDFGEGEQLERLVQGVQLLARKTPIALLLAQPPRERVAARDLDRVLAAPGIRRVEPGRYVDRVSLECGAGAIVTDAGSTQDEASALGVPCFTLRESTERAVTLIAGTNVLLGADPAGLEGVEPQLRGAQRCDIPLWDGHAGERAANVLLAHYAVI